MQPFPDIGWEKKNPITNLTQDKKINKYLEQPNSQDESNNQWILN